MRSIGPIALRLLYNAVKLDHIGTNNNPEESLRPGHDAGTRACNETSRQIRLHTEHVTQSEYDYSGGSCVDDGRPPDAFESVDRGEVHIQPHHVVSVLISYTDRKDVLLSSTVRLSIATQCNIGAQVVSTCQESGQV